MFLIINVLKPDYGEVMMHTSKGQMCLGIAVSLQMMGLFAIRKITAVRV